MAGKLIEEDAERENVSLLRAAMDAWDANGVLSAKDKQILDVPVATELGVMINGRGGLLGCSQERIKKTILALLYLMGRS